MSENPDKPNSGSAPRSGAGDPARTQRIPRISEGAQRGEGQSAAAKRRPASSTPGTSRPAAKKSSPPAKESASSSSQNGSASSGPDAPPAAAASTPAAKKAAPAARPTSGGTKPAARSTAKPGQTAPKQQPAQESSAGATGTRPAAREQSRREPGSGRPLTAGDYARTTAQSPSSTAVIPAVKDAPTAAPAAQPAPASAGGRQASLRLVRVDPWSVTRLAFVVSVALMIVSVVAVTIFWVVLDLTGIWDQVNGSVTNVLSDNEGSFDLTDYLGLGRLVGLTLVLSAINVVLMTALATIAAHLYNLAAQLLGGIRVTFSDD